MQYEYYYQQLSIIERKIYRTVSDGIKEFNEILADHNLEFKDGKLIQIKAPTQE